MPIQMADTLTLDGIKKTREGYLAVDARVARTGIQEYLGSEVGKPDMKKVRVYRPEAEVFHTDTIASFSTIAVTNDHPREMVTADNWRKYGVGETGDEILRDGQFMRIPMLVRDAAAISDVEGGKRELSCGYTCDLDWTAGRTDDGLEYDAIQTNIRGNHVAIVSRARGGGELKIGDENMPDIKLTTIVRDGVPVDVNDAAKIVIEGLDTKLTKALADAAGKDTQIATLTTQNATKDAEIVTLNKRIEDLQITPAKLRDAAKSFAATVSLAKQVAPTFQISDAMGEAEIKSGVVKQVIGDAAKDWNDVQIDASFASLTAGKKVGDTVDTFATGFKDAAVPTNIPQVVQDARAEMLKNLTQPFAAKSN